MAIAESNLQTAVSVLRDTAVRLLVKQTLKRMMTTNGLSWLTWPMLNPLTSYFLELAFRYLLTKTALGLSLLWIITDNYYEVNNANDARARLIDMIEHPEKYTEGAMREIEANFDDAAVELINIRIERV